MPVTADDFRRMALDLPEAEERAHMDHPDFRVAGKIFASLGYPEDGFAMVKLHPEMQHEFMTAEPKVFVPAAGAWGRGGSTTVRLKSARKSTLRSAVVAAWRNTAPKQLVESYDSGKRA